MYFASLFYPPPHPTHTSHYKKDCDGLISVRKTKHTFLGIHWSSVEPSPSLPKDPLPQVYSDPESGNKIIVKLQENETAVARHIPPVISAS